jgi:hypothetical protein
VNATGSRCTAPLLPAIMAASAVAAARVASGAWGATPSSQIPAAAASARPVSTPG